MSGALKRYTQLPFLLQMLRETKMALLDPASWEDRNDAYYVDLFKKKHALNSIFALCLTTASTTFHHWKIFAGSTSGVCLYFNYDKVASWADGHHIQFRKVCYYSLSKAHKNLPTKSDLPFRKRHAFEPEEEFRLLFSSREPQTPSRAFKFDLGMLEKIEVNPWLPESAFQAVSDTIHDVKGCKSLLVEQSHLLNNKEWAAIADHARDA